MALAQKIGSVEEYDILHQINILTIESDNKEVFPSPPVTYPVTEYIKEEPSDDNAKFTILCHLETDYCDLGEREDIENDEDGHIVEETIENEVPENVNEPSNLTTPKNIKKQKIKEKPKQYHWECQPSQFPANIPDNNFEPPNDILYCHQ